MRINLQLCSMCRTGMYHTFLDLQICMCISSSKIKCLHTCTDMFMPVYVYFYLGVLHPDVSTVVLILVQDFMLLAVGQTIIALTS